MSSTEMTSSERREMLIGEIAKNALVEVCKDPNDAYAAKIRRSLKRKHGMTVNSLEIGAALKLLKEREYVKSREMTKHPLTGRQVVFYVPTAAGSLAYHLSAK